MTFEETYKIVNKIPAEGWMTESDCRVIYDYVSKLEKVEILEIGAYAGRSGLMIALSSPTSHLTSVDLCTEVTETTAYKHTVGWDYVKGEPTRILNELVDTHDNWDLIVGDSQDVAKTWTKELDVLFIDGGHSYEQCKADIISWTPFLKTGCYLFMHDYSHIPDVIKASNEMLKNYERITAPYQDKYGKTQWGVFKKL